MNTDPLDQGISCGLSRNSLVMTEPKTVATVSISPTENGKEFYKNNKGQATEKSVGWDLYAAVTIVIPPKTTSLVPLGLVVKPQAGTYVKIYARSSLHKQGLMLANGVGIIDPDYCGAGDELLAPLYNFTDQPVEVARGNRIVQLVVEQAIYPVVVPFTPKTKSRGGIGSSGI